MINVDDRFVTETMPQIGAKATVVLLAICKHAGVKKTAFPSKATIQKYTGLGRDAVTKNINLLVEKGILEKKQRRTTDGKRNSTNLYTIKTKYLKVYIESNHSLEQKNLDHQPTDFQATDFQATDFQATDFQPTESQATISINQVIEVLTNNHLSINQIILNVVVAESKLSEVDVFKIQIQNDLDFLKLLKKNLKISEESIFDFSDKFITEKIGLSQLHDNWGKAKKNFYFWLKKQDLKKEKSSAKKEKVNQELDKKWKAVFLELKGVNYQPPKFYESDLLGLESTMINSLQQESDKAPTEKNKADFLELLMREADKDDFLSKQLSPAIIDKKFSNIIANAKSNTKGINQAKQRAREAMFGSSL